MRPIFLLVISLSLLAGCATPYQSNSFLGGYSETQLAPDVFRIRFRGNAFTSMDRAQDFALLHAADLAQQHGYLYFAVVDESNSTTVSTFTTPGQSSSSCSGYVSSGGSFSYSGTTTYYPGQTYNFYKPNTGLLIRCFVQKPDSIYTFDAEFLQRMIMQKYDLEGSSTKPLRADGREDGYNKNVVTATPDRQPQRIEQSFTNETKLETPGGKTALPDVPHHVESSPQKLGIKEQAEMSNNISIPSRRDALGCKVYTTSGDYLGKVASIMNNGYGDHYIVMIPGKSKVYEIDATEESFEEIDLKARR